jgi:glycosyltransferase involved in cell wall biosynthesis
VRAVDVCTIIAKNYVAQARVLARSFAEHHPDGRFWTLIIDDFADHIDPQREPFTILTPADIGCEPFEDMAVRYNVLELSTAVKPWLLRHLMAEVKGSVTYLDPDIQVFGSLERLERLALEHGLVLTPHNSEPIPPDGKKPSQIDIMIAGVYNLGYVSLAPGAEIDRLLDWWSDRLRRDCRVDPIYGYFVDQRWFDLAPGFVSDYAIVRDPQYNVAYWNLHSRELAHDGERYTVDGQPLAFFHFSGFDPGDTGVLSRHQDRVDVASYPTVRRILEEYAEAARKEGYGLAKEWPYTFDQLADGTPLDPVVRKLYIEAEARGELAASPFGADGAEALLEWLGDPAPDGPPGVSRLLAHIYAERVDLREAFPDLNGPGLGGLLEWSQNGGREEVPALGRLPLTDSAEYGAVAAPRPARSELWGVNVVGYFRSELGVGEAARQVVTALDAAGVPALAVHGATLPLSRQGHMYTQSDHRDAQFPVNLICVNADMLPDFANSAGERFFAGRYSIGLWFWEVSRFREEWQGSFELLDEVWAPTAHVAQALAPVSPIPVVPMRIPVEMPPIVPRSRAELGVPEGFFFLFSFDYLSVFERKNPLALVEAFMRAFTPGEGPSLVLKCINAERDPTNHERLLAAADEHPDVHVIDRYLTPADKNTLTATCDCYVSLHRSEGFGLTMAEAMYVGKPVIATGYSGNLDFMTAENGLLVDYELVPIGPGSPPYPADGEWADPSVEHAAALMRLVFDDPVATAALGARAAQDIHRSHSPEAAGELMRSRLEHLRRLGASGRHAAGDGERPMVVDSLAPRVQRGPVAGPSSKVGPVGGVARRGALRLMRPFTAYQETVNAEVVRSLDTISDEFTDQIENLSERLVRANAIVLGQLRSHDGMKALPAVIEAQSRAVEDVQGTLTELGGRVDQIEGEGHALETDRTLYTALALLAERHRAISGQSGASTATGSLAPYELRVFSQNGEDGVLAEILARIGVGERFFVEFGVESGHEGNCVYLADVAGWNGLFMDCDDEFFAELERKYRVEDRVQTVRAMITPGNVQELFTASGVPAELDVLSIDVDGADYWIWEAVDAYRPRVVVIEYNSALDPSRRLVQPADLEGGWDGTNYYGASLGALRALGGRKDYRLVHTELSGVNAFFVREDLAKGRFPAAEEVSVRGAPNYFQHGHGHPPDLVRRRYLDLDGEELVEAVLDSAPESGE